MWEVRSTIIEQNYPPVRRHQQPRTSLITEQQLNRTKEGEESMLAHYNRIHDIIDAVDDHITRRLENHETEVFSIVKNEIAEMKEETRKAVEALNVAIAQKNTEDEIWKLNNELDYFKNQTYQLFQQNKRLRAQMAALRTTAHEKELDLKNADILLQKLKRNCLKDKLTRQRISSNLKQRIQDQRPLTAQAIDELMSGKGERVHTEPVPDRKKAKIEQSTVHVELGERTREMGSKVEESPDQSFPSLSLHQEIMVPPLPQVKMKRVQSFFTEAVEYRPTQKTTTGTQTDAVSQNNDAKSIRPGEPKNPPPAKAKKDIDLLRNGFYMVSYSGRNSKNERYMGVALQRGKLSGLNKSSMK